MTALTVTDEGKTLSFTLDDILKFHGPGFPGGVAHGFKVMERAFPLLDGGKVPERNDIRIETRFPGPGGRDALELVTRALIRGRFTLLPFDDAAMTWRDRYFFRFIYRGKTVEASLAEGDLVRDEFRALGQRAQKEKLSDADEARLAWLKQEMCDRLMSLPADKVYNARTL